MMAHDHREAAASASMIAFTTGSARRKELTTLKVSALVAGSGIRASVSGPRLGRAGGDNMTGRSV